MFKKIKQKIKDIYEAYIIGKYVRIGCEFGDMYSYSYLGDAIGYDMYHDSWKHLEEKIIKMGYKPYTLKQFVKAGGYGQPLPSFQKERRK